MTTPAPVDEPDDANLRVGPPAGSAAGLTGVAVALRHVRDEAGWRRGIPALLHLNQADGIDCPGCAWPEPDHRSRAEFCENGAKAIAEEATLRRVDAEFFARHPVSQLRTHGDYWLGKQGRLTEPVYRRSGAERFEPISWDAAFELTAQALRGAGPNRTVCYTSGRTSNEAAFLYQLLARCHGTNHLPDCSNMCHESSGVALTQTIGLGKGTVSLTDLYEADVILVVGQNPGTNHPRMLSALETARHNGAHIVAINPLPEAGLQRFKNPQRARGVIGSGTELADLHLPITLGADLALFLTINQQLMRRGAIDEGFVQTHTRGYDTYSEYLTTLDGDALIAATGLNPADVATLIDWIAGTQRIVICWAMGLTQQRQAVATIRELTNTVLLRGAIGVPGAGLCPVRGHSNVQGDRTMGIYEKPSAAFLDRLEAAIGIEMPREHGYDTVEAIHAMADGGVDVFLAMGGNFVSAAPDTDFTEAALGRVGLTVHVATKLNRTHLVASDAALVLPCLGRTERDVTANGPQFVTVEDSMSVVHRSTGHLAPASPSLRSEVAIVCGIAERLFTDPADPRHEIPWAEFAQDYHQIRDVIETAIDGFDQFNDRVRSPQGFTLPHPARTGRFTGDGTAAITINPFDPTPVPPGRLVLQTLRSHDQYNTTIYGLDDRYRGITGGRRIVLVNERDRVELGFAPGAVVDVISEAPDGTERRGSAFRLVDYPTPRGTAAAYFPEANVLVPIDSVAAESNTPVSKAIIVRFEPAEGGPEPQ